MPRVRRPGNGTVPAQFGPHPRQALRIILLQKGDEILADFAAQVPRLRGIGRGGQDAQLHRLFCRIAHLQIPKALVPKRIVFDDRLERPAAFLHRKSVIHPHKNRTEQPGCAARPVLKRLLDEITQRQNPVGSASLDCSLSEAGQSCATEKHQAELRTQRPFAPRLDRC